MLIPVFHTKRHIHLLLSWIIMQVCLLNAAPSLAQIKTERLLENGRTALYFNDYVLAIHYFNRCLSLRPTQSLPYYYRAVAKIQLEDYTGSIIDCDSALAHNPFMPDAWLARGYACLRTGMAAQAENDLNKALIYAPDNTNAILYRIEALKKQDKYEAALNDIRRLLRRKNLPFANLLRTEQAQVYLAMNDTSAANLSLDTAIFHAPSHPDFYALKAYISLLQNQDSVALSLLNTAISLGADYPAVYVNRGVLLHKSFRYLDALTDYSRAVELDPDDRQARFNRAILRSEVGDFNNALLDLNRLLDDHPSSTFYDEARFQRAIVCLRLHDFNTALSDFATLMARYPDFTPAYYGHAEACQALGRTRQADIDRYKAMIIESQPVSERKRLRAQGEPAASSVPSALSVLTDSWNSTDTPGEGNDRIRGNIQQESMHLIPRSPFCISYYAPLSRVESESAFRFHAPALPPAIRQFNTTCGEHLVLTNRETPTSEHIISLHQQRIRTLTSPYAHTYFLRAVNHSMILNHRDAMNDLDTAFAKTSSASDSALHAVVCFQRGSIRLRQITHDSLISYSPSYATTSAPDTLNRWRESDLIALDFQLAVRFSPHFPHAWYNLGCLFLMKNQNQKAEEAFSKAIALDANLADAWFNRAIARLRLYRTSTDQLLLRQAREDLSMAGQHGIYQSYSILKQLDKSSPSIQ